MIKLGIVGSGCTGPDLHPARWQTVKCPPIPSVCERFVRSIETGVQDQPDFARGAGIQKVLDACFISDQTRQIVAV